MIFDHNNFIYRGINPWNGSFSLFILTSHKTWATVKEWNTRLNCLLTFFRSSFCLCFASIILWSIVSATFLISGHAEVPNSFLFLYNHRVVRLIKKKHLNNIPNYHRNISTRIPVLKPVYIKKCVIYRELLKKS